jgi:hypothetical protein
VGFELWSRKNWFFRKYGPAHEAGSRTGEAIRFNIFENFVKVLNFVTVLKKDFSLLSGLKRMIWLFCFNPKKEKSKICI